MNNRIIPLLLFIGFAFWSCGNNAPVIKSLTAEPETTSIGGTVLLTCIAHDEEDQTFVYTWDCTLGTIVGDGQHQMKQVFFLFLVKSWIVTMAML
jgi:hypothetical protein